MEEHSLSSCNGFAGSGGQLSQNISGQWTDVEEQESVAGVLGT